MQFFWPLPQSVDRRLPELDRAVVALRLVRRVLRARALRELVHDLARLLVDRRLAEVDRLLRLRLRRRDVLHPLVGAVRVLRLRGEHPRVEPAGHALLRDHRGDRHLGRLQRVDLVRPRGADRRPAVLEQVDLVGREGPVLLHERPLLLEQLHRRVELRLRQLVRVLDPEAGFVFDRYSAASAIWIGLSGIVILPLFSGRRSRPSSSASS